MYSLELTGGPQISISHRNYVSTFAMDGSAPNPLEAFYAAIAGCAGVYAHKACVEMSLDSSGITISCKPFSQPGNPLVPKKIKTTVHFPPRFSEEQQTAIVANISRCAVKEIVKAGSSIDFEIGIA
jgi:uncharacterized OsmC-like protein